MAKKSLRERLIECSERNNAQDSVKRFATFLKLWEEIEQAYWEGWSYKEIWRVLARDGQIDFSYSSFLGFTRKMKQRQLAHEHEKTRGTGRPAPAIAAGKRGQEVKPGATRVDLPLFGQDVKPRDPKRF